MKNVLLAFTLFSSLTLLSQPTENLDFQPHFAACIVSDIETSQHWYRTIFDLEIINQNQSEEHGYKIVNLANETFKLELIQLDYAIDPDSLVSNPKARFIGYFKVGFQVENLNEWIDHLKIHKVNFVGNTVTDPVSGKNTLIILDPDGNRIQLFD